MNIARHLQHAAAVWSNQPALAVGGNLHSTYAAFSRRVAALATHLRDEHAIAPGDRVVLFLYNSAAYLELLYAIWHAGAVAVPVNAKLHPLEAAWIVNNAGARLAVVDAAHASDLAAHCPVQQLAVEKLHMEQLPIEQLHADATPLPLTPRAPDDLAWLFYTSGTTGKPKGVMLTHHNLDLMTLAYLANVNPMGPHDRLLHAAPISHGSGLYGIAAVQQAALQIIPAAPQFDAAEVFALAAFWREVSFFAAPTMVKRLVAYAKESRMAVAGLKTIIYGGGPMYLADAEEAVAVLGPCLAQIYGQGESPMTITVLPKDVIADRSHPDRAARLASVGFAQPIVEVSIRDESGQQLPVGEVGEVCVRGQVVMAGYWQNPEATAATIRDGWLWTGDVGCLDAAGFLTLKDRSKDLIISGGTNIYPREVEEVLLTCPGVHEVSVIGVPDAEWGESVMAFVVADPTVDIATLAQHCITHIARFKRPKAWRFVAELPKNNYGKVLKTSLRALLAAEAVPAPAKTENSR